MASKPRVVIVHGHLGDAQQGWLGRLGEDCRERGIEVVDPALPEGEKYADLATWMDVLRAEIGELDEQTILVGHSMGCPAILRYLTEELARHPGSKLAGVILVAGFYADDERARRYFGEHPNFEAIIRAAARRACIFSDNDKLVDPAKSRELAKALDADSLELTGRGHFNNFEDRSLDEVEELIQDFLKS